MKKTRKIVSLCMGLMCFSMIVSNFSYAEVPRTYANEGFQGTDLPTPESVIKPPSTLPDPKDVIKVPAETGEETGGTTTSTLEGVIKPPFADKVEVPQWPSTEDIIKPPFKNAEEITSNLETESDFWGQAGKWFSMGNNSKELNENSQKIVDTFSDMINVFGTTAIVLATIFLGIKYMFGSVDAKANVKESLVTLLVACVFFFGWTSISNLLFDTGTKYQFIFTNNQDTSYTNMVGRIFNTATFAAQFFAVGAVIYVGVKYILSGASGKADLKAKSMTFLIGIIMAFASTAFLGQISKVVNEALAK